MKLSGEIEKKLASLRAILKSRGCRNKYAELASGRVSLKDIEVLSIEFCSICNLSCRYCFLSGNERPSFLEISVYKKLLREICGNSSFEIKIMEWPISGCFFLHPRHKEIIEITKEHEEKHANFKPWVILNDNMMLFDKEEVDFILSKGVVNHVICSIDGVDKESFEQMRPKADFNRVLENTRYLLEKNKELDAKVVIQINNGRDKACSAKSLDPGLKEILKKADYVTRWNPVDWNDSFHTGLPHYFAAKHFCSFVFESAVLSTSGAILKCCMDLKESTKYGDFSKDTLESIWFSQARLAFLKMMHEGRRGLIPGCSNCSITYVRQNRLGG